MLRFNLNIVNLFSSFNKLPNVSKTLIKNIPSAQKKPKEKQYYLREDEEKRNYKTILKEIKDLILHSKIQPCELYSEYGPKFLHFHEAARIFLRTAERIRSGACIQVILI
jgi:hypothetical protein